MNGGSLTSGCAGVHSQVTGVRANDDEPQQAIIRCTMGLFKPDLYRSFAIGFLIGVAALGATVGGDARAEMMARVTPGAVR